jgi:hypothetical protein
VGQRPDAIQNLIEKILRTNLLHDLPVDAIANAKQPVAVNPVWAAELGRDPCEQAPIVPII